MVVRNEHCIDWRQPVKIHGRGNPPVRPDELYRRSAIAPYRVCENVQSTDLKQESRVADPGDCEQIRICARNDVVRRYLHENPWVRVRATRISPSLDQRPFEEVQKTVHFG